MAWPYENSLWHVYLMTNQVNGKKYVGITTKSLEARVQEHVNDAYSGSPYALHAAIRKYGPENFTIQLLTTAKGLSKARELETGYILTYDTYASGRGTRNGYNMSFGGEDPDPPWRKRE